MAGVFDLELHDAPDQEEDISDDEYLVADDQIEVSFVTYGRV